MKYIVVSLLLLVVLSGCEEQKKQIKVPLQKAHDVAGFADQQTKKMTDEAQRALDDSKGD